MAAETILLLSGNPAKRKRKSKKHRTAAQRAATRKLVALNKSRSSKRRTRRKHARSANSVRPFTGAIMAKRRKSRRRSFRRNPISGVSVRNSLNMFKPAITGAVGALSLNGVLNHAPIPPQLLAGKMAYVTKSALAIAIGVLGSKVGPLRRYAPDMARGALTMVMVDAGKELAASAGVNLSGVGFINPGFIAGPRAAGTGALQNTMGRIGRVGQYVNNGARMNGIGRVGQYVGMRGR